MKNFETERLILQPTSTEDAHFILELMNTPKWLQFIGDRRVKTIQDADNYIHQNYFLQRQRLGFSTFTVLRKADKEKLGVVGLYDRETVEGIDLGFAFLEKYERQGYAHEASKKLLSLSFTDFGLSELKAITHEDNLASQRLLVKLGFCKLNLIHIGDKEEVILYQKQHSIVN